MKLDQLKKERINEAYFGVCEKGKHGRLMLELDDGTWISVFGIAERISSADVQKIITNK